MKKNSNEQKLQHLDEMQQSQVANQNLNDDTIEDLVEEADDVIGDETQPEEDSVNEKSLDENLDLEEKTRKSTSNWN